MKKSIRTIFIVMIGLSMLTLSGFVVTKKVAPTFANNDRHFKAHSLLNASQEDIKQTTLDYIAEQIKILSGNPEVIHTQKINALDLPKYDLDTINYTKLMVIVIVKGDFDVNGSIPTGVRDTATSIPEHYKYLACGFDAATGEFMLLEASKDRGAFGRILNDPGLPPQRVNNVTVSNESGYIPPPTAPIGEGRALFTSNN